MIKNNMSAIAKLIGPVKHGVPLPPPRVYPNNPARMVEQAIAELQEGDCRDFAWFNKVSPTTFHAYLLRVAKRVNVPISTRKKEDGSGITVWRIAQFRPGRVRLRMFDSQCKLHVV